MKTHNGTQVNADKYGNPRYVWHFLDFVTREEQEKHSIEGAYLLAVNKANKIGGRKYRGRDFGGGIVFTTYAPERVQEKIDGLKNG